MSVVDGDIISVNNKSGHYTPTPALNDQIKEELLSRGVDISEIEFDWSYSGLNR